MKPRRERRPKPDHARVPATTREAKAAEDERLEDKNERIADDDGMPPAVDEDQRPPA